MTKEERKQLFTNLIEVCNGQPRIPARCISDYLFITGIFKVSKEYEHMVKGFIEEENRKLESKVLQLAKSQTEFDIKVYLKTKDNFFLDRLIRLFI